MLSLWAVTLCAAVGGPRITSFEPNYGQKTPLPLRCVAGHQVGRIDTVDGRIAAGKRGNHGSLPFYDYG
jgi:hypothetical protein